MPTIETSIKIPAPIEKVFATMVNPEDIPKFAPIHAVSNIKGKPEEKGSSADYEYHFLGMRLRQTLTVLDVRKPNEIVYEMAGGFPGKWTYTLEQQEDDTMVRTKVQYSVRGGMVGKIANWLIFNQMNSEESGAWTSRTKELLRVIDEISALVFIVRKLALFNGQRLVRWLRHHP